MASRQLDLISAGAKASSKQNSGGGSGGKRGGGGGGDAAPPPRPTDASLAIEAERRYLTYAVSVITSRALPDVRDGLKPVQRRILYTMYNDLHLTFDGRTRKCAKIVGDVLGNYHPHGDIAAYEALVRLAQDFVMRVPLVLGQGNFGSVDGDRPAADRYTEAKLTAVSERLMTELRQRTV